MNSRAIGPKWVCRSGSRLLRKDTEFGLAHTQFEVSLGYSRGPPEWVITSRSDVQERGMGWQLGVATPRAGLPAKRKCQLRMVAGPREESWATAIWEHGGGRKHCKGNQGEELPDKYKPGCN